jgi:hypothetical protein
MAGYIHVGRMIAELLEQQHRTKSDLGYDLGMSPGNVVYLTKRESVDVQMLHKIGNNLKYNFWKHYPIDDGSTGLGAFGDQLKKVADEKDKVIAELNAQIAKQERMIEDLKQELVRQENSFLKEINGLLKKK